MITGRNIAVLLKIIAMKDKAWSQTTIASSLDIPQSEVSNSLQKLKEARLLNKINKKIVVSISSCEEFFLHGFRYVFPQVRTGCGRGIPTSYAAPIFKNHFSVNENKPIWILSSGKISGEGIEPLYDKLPEIISKSPDDEFYQLLVTVDALREPKLRARNLGKKIFLGIMDDYAKQQHSHSGI